MSKTLNIGGGLKLPFRSQMSLKLEGDPPACVLGEEGFVGSVYASLVEASRRFAGRLTSRLRTLTIRGHSSCCSGEGGGRL